MSEPVRCRTCGHDMILVNDPALGWLVTCRLHTDAGHLNAEIERIQGDYDRARAWELIVNHRAHGLRDEAAHRGQPFTDEAT